MRISVLALATVLAFPLGGCAGLGGQDAFGGVFGDVLGGSQTGMGGQSFQDAAVEACANEARRYGYVSISDVRAQNSSTLRVNGIVDTNSGRRGFGCSFREDGRITDFGIR